MSSLQRSSRFPASTRRWTRSSSRSTWRTLMRGLSDEYGSWKTIWTARRSSALRLGPSSRPSKRTVPAVGTNWPTMHLATVVLPHPDSPTSPSTSPRSTLRLTSPTACEPLSVLDPESDRQALDLDERPRRSRAHPRRCASGPRPAGCGLSHGSPRPARRPEVRSGGRPSAGRGQPARGLPRS